MWMTLCFNKLDKCIGWWPSGIDGGFYVHHRLWYTIHHPNKVVQGCFAIVAGTHTSASNNGLCRGMGTGCRRWWMPLILFSHILMRQGTLAYISQPNLLMAPHSLQHYIVRNSSSVEALEATRWPNLPKSNFSLWWSHQVTYFTGIKDKFPTTSKGWLQGWSWHWSLFDIVVTITRRFTCEVPLCGQWDWKSHTAHVQDSYK